MKMQIALNLKRRMLLGALLAGAGLRAAHALSALQVVFCQDTTANDYRAAQVAAVRRWFELYAPHVALRVYDAASSSMRQMLDIEKAEGAQVLLLGAVPGAPLAPVLQRARRRGMIIIGISRKVPGFLFDTLVHADNYQIGLLAAELLHRLRPEGGRVAMLEGPAGAFTAQERARGFRDALARFPAWQLVASADAGYLRHRAAKVVQQWHEVGIDYDALFAHSDSMLIGARAAWHRLGVDPRSLLTIGVDYISEARSAMLAGLQTASIRYPLFADEACEAAWSWLHGFTPPAYIEVALEVITAREAPFRPPIF